MPRWLVVLIAVVSSDAALAELNVNLLAGTRDETDSEDRLPAIAVALDFGQERWRIRPELSYALGFDPLYAGEETELSIGGITYWQAETSRIHFGAGLSDISKDWGANQGSSTTGYVHGGVTWRLNARRLGLDVRYLNADDFMSYGVPFPVGYLQVALQFV